MVETRPRRRALVADDSNAVRSQLARWLERRGYAVDTAEDGRRLLALIDEGASPDVIFLDVWMPDPDGLATLSELRRRHPEVPVVLFSVDAKASTIVEAMRRGATDFLPKPLVEADLDAVLERLFPSGRPESEAGVEEILWSGRSLTRIRELIDQIAVTDVTVLIQGESGVGKEVVARVVHEASRRAGGPFVKVNCAALPGELLESELFGYERGAFTGATARKPGKFELADGGTIFLDEIGEMSPAAQAKLLHVLQDGTFTRLGGNREIAVQSRVVSATNRPLDEMVAGGSFRADLFYRLNVVGLTIPPLRERREEVPRLIAHFARRYAQRYARQVPTFSATLLRLLEEYEFPGNVRELENLVKRIVVLGTEEPIVARLTRRLESEGSEPFESFLERIESTAGEIPLREVGRLASQQVERLVITRALLRTHWNRRAAADLLGVSYKTLLQKIRECGIEREG